MQEVGSKGGSYYLDGSGGALLLTHHMGQFNAGMGLDCLGFHVCASNKLPSKLNLVNMYKITLVFLYSLS
jgi:hypothetical protein